MNSEKIKYCTELADEVITNFELGTVHIDSILMKSLRLFRILGNEEGTLLFKYETAGYPRGINSKLTDEAYRIGEIAGRTYFEETEDGKSNRRMKTILLSEIESQLSSYKERLKVCLDPDISVSSSNPHEFVTPKLQYLVNYKERAHLTTKMYDYTKDFNTIRGNLYNYVLEIYNKLRFENVIEQMFSRDRAAVNDKLSQLCPNAIGKFVSVYENIDSGNAEDWANAVHSCRRILIELADVLYPPTDTPVETGGKSIKVGQEQYVNRIIQYISSKKNSETYMKVIGSNLSHIGERLDATVNAVCKGTHTEVAQAEAERYIIYTYTLLADILSL